MDNGPQPMLLTLPANKANQKQISGKNVAITCCMLHNFRAISVFMCAHTHMHINTYTYID